MSFYASSCRLPKSFCLVLTSFLQRPGLPFADVITEESIEQAFADGAVTFGQDDSAIYTPAITLWAFLSQVLFKAEQRSCLAAVARVAVLLVALDRGPCTSNSGAYCRARSKLPEQVIRRLTVEVADGCEKVVKDKWLWHGRHIQLADGTTVSMPDTSENQAVYPQPAAQSPGLGFPIARLVVLFSLATGMLRGMALGPYAGKETGETALLRSLLEGFDRQDILLADRYYCSYFMIALLMEWGVDVVTRVNRQRTVDFRRGRRLGSGDHLVEWPRSDKPEWMDSATYDRMPRSIRIREIHVQVNHPGFRVESLVVVTTLRDARTYPAADIAELYGFRWLAELDIRVVKVSLGLDVVRCLTPEMVRKEIWTALLAYNLIRRIMLQAAQGTGRTPRQLSFSAALQTVAASWLVIVLASDTVAERLVEAQLENLAEHLIGQRPGRVEPRAVKRRPKQQALLTKPRDQARAELLAHRL